MTAEIIKEQLLKTSNEVIKLAREKCSNNISENILFVIRRFDAANLDFNEISKLRKIKYKNSVKHNIDDIVEELNKEKKNISWIDITLFKVEKNKSILEIQLIKRQSEELNDSQKSSISFHGGIPIPQYAANSNKKFDINWQQNSIKHKWLMFWWKIKQTSQR